MKPSYLATTLRDLPEDLPHNLLCFFGIELLRHSCIAGHIGKEDGDMLAFAVRNKNRLFFYSKVFSNL